MATSAYASTPETTNANRASRVLLGPCSDQLRDVLRRRVDPVNFHHVIRHNRPNLPRLTLPQKDLILPRTGHYSGDYSDMDISLLYLLLRNICNIPPHLNGWGNSPDVNDNSLAANIERIREEWNKVCHTSSTSLSITDLTDTWSTIKDAVKSVDSFLNNSNKYEKEMDFLLTETMEQLRKQVEEDTKTFHKVMRLEESVHDEVDISRLKQRLLENNDLEIPRQEDSDSLPVEQLFASVIIREDFKDIRKEKKSAQGVKEQEWREVKTPEDMLTKNGKPVRNVFMLGDAAHGKTAYCTRLLKKWCNAQKPGMTGRPLNKWENAVIQFDFVFLIEFRYVDPSKTNVIDMICQDILGEDAVLHTAVKHVLSSDNYRRLIIMDGSDEWKPDQGMPIINSMSDCVIFTNMQPWMFSAVAGLERDTTLTLKDGRVQLSKRENVTESVTLQRRSSHDRKLSPFIVSLPYPSDDLANFEYVGCELGNILRDMEGYFSGNWNFSNLYENVECFIIIHDSRKAVEAFCLDYFNAEPNIEECEWDGISKYVSAFPEDATICLCVFDRILETVHSETMENIMENTIRHFDMKDVIVIVCRPNQEFSKGKTRIQVIADHVPSLLITSFHDQSGKESVMRLLYERRRRLIDYCITIIGIDRTDEKIDKSIADAIRDLEELKEICWHRNKEEFSYNIQNISQVLQSLASNSFIACALDEYQLIIYVEEDLDICKIQQIKQNFPYLTVEIRRRTRKDQCIVVPHYQPGESIFSTDHQPLGTLGMFGQLENGTFVVITSPHVIARSQTALIQNGGNLIDLGRCIWSPRRGLEESVPSIDDIAVIEILPNVRNTMEYRIAISNVEIFERESSALNRKRVFKYGAKTNYTEGHVQNSQLNLYSKEVAKSVCFIIIRENRRDRNFSEPGDSGAIVFTKDGTKYVAIGMIYGGITLPEFQNMSAAIRLDDAVDKFKESTHQHLFLSRF